MSTDSKYRGLLKRVLISQAVIAGILVVSVVGYTALSAQKPGVESKATDPAPLNIDSYAAESVTFREIITAYGTARPDREVVVAAQVSGEIVSVHPHLEVGLRVVAPHVSVTTEENARSVDGDTLIQIDQRDYINRSHQAKNRVSEASREIEQLHQQQTNGERVLEKAKADLAAFQEDYDRYLKAVELRAGARAELTRALVALQRHRDSIVQMENQLQLYPLQIAAAQERLATSKVESQRAEDDLERTVIQPPFNGVISEVMVEQGQFVRAGEPLVRLTDPDRIDIPVAIGLEDFRRISASVRGGEIPKVELATSESLPGVWEGTITRVAPEADPGSRTIQVFVEVVNSEQEQRLLPGTFVHARIKGGENPDRVVIPRAAILNDHVFVIGEGDEIQRQLVVQGRRLRSLVVIDSGLKGGERIAVTNLTLLEDGRKVAVQQQTDLADEMQMSQFPVIETEDSLPEATQLDSAQGPASGATARE